MGIREWLKWIFTNRSMGYHGVSLREYTSLEISAEQSKEIVEIDPKINQSKDSERISSSQRKE